MKLVLTLVVLAVAAATIWEFDQPPEAPATESTAAVTEGEFIVYSTYSGKVESRNVVTIMSRFQGTATVVELAPEGAQVEEGDLLVRFDSAKLKRDLVKLESENALARSELDGLERAKLPMELRDLELALAEAETDLQAEGQYLEDSIELQKEKLISIQEVKQQQRKVDSLQSRLDNLTTEVQLTRQYLHPSLLERARTKLHSAKRGLDLAQQQLAASEVRAPTSGVVVYKQLNIGGEFRTVRVGDSVYPNQPFMVLPDMHDLVVHFDIPESELSRVEKFGDSYIRPLAFPNLTLPGTIETVGSVAQTLPGKPGWQKFFHVTVGVDEIEPLIRPGMSVTVSVLSSYKEIATLIPRRAVSWNGGKALTRIVIGQTHTIRELSLGQANDMFYEVIEGVESGDHVVLR